MMVRIKICGLTTPDTVSSAAEAGATHVGFNFYPPSPRFVTADLAGELAKVAPNHVTKVGVFVDAEDALLEANVAAGQLDAIQLHGKESRERLEEIKARFGLPVWKVLSVENAADVLAADAYRSLADLILFDTKTPKGALPGGMGMGFDWSLLESFDKSQAWGLAGGLDPANVAHAIRATAAPLVDTASGVESSPGVKDPAKIAAFCAAALSA
ncbi:MAG: phosphoribosylanthranilate isomerase [Pseudomonadota bacterium]